MKRDLSSYKKLNDREHILLRPNMYLGSVDITESEEYILEGEKFVQKKVLYIPGLLKMINEIIDNSVDEALRTNFVHSNKIEIEITSNSVTIHDNGRGIPVELMNGTDQYIPFLLFTEAKAGSNFSEDKRETIGMNGVGSVLTNVFSKLFKVETSDGKKKFTLTCENNNETQKFKIKDTDKTGTSVYFEPDFKRFKIKDFNPIYEDLIRQRLIFLSYTYPDIQFKLNGNRITRVNDKKFIGHFCENFEMYSNENYSIAVSTSETDDFKHLSYVNGLFIKNGGNHIQHISNLIVGELRTKLERKYKAIRPADIRNKLFLLVFFKKFPNMKFDSQTKENLTNSVTEIKDYLGDFDYVKLGKQIIKNEQIFFHIEENYKIKEEFQHRKELQVVAKVGKKVKIEKYLPPIKEQKYISLTEGDSAKGGLSAVLGRQEFGFFPLRGKPLNVYGTAMSKIVANEELKNIITILEIDVTKEVKDMAYESVLISTDQDSDGILIRGLLIAFFHRFTPDLIKQGRIKYLNTPIMYTKGKNGLPDHWIYDMRESSKLKGTTFYSKGLGSWKSDDLKHIVETDGIDNMIQTFSYDENSESSIDLWLGNNSDIRKNELMGSVFRYTDI